MSTTRTPVGREMQAACIAPLWSRAELYASMLSEALRDLRDAGGIAEAGRALGWSPDEAGEAVVGLALVGNLIDAELGHLKAERARGG